MTVPSLDAGRTVNAALDLGWIGLAFQDQDEQYRFSRTHLDFNWIAERHS